MKKDKKFLQELENELNSINKKQRDAIVLKYRNIIDEELNNKRKIKEILKEIGTPKSVAEKEIEELKKENKFENIKAKIIIIFSKTKEIIKRIGKSVADTTKKLYSGITKDIQFKSKEEKDKIKKNKTKEKNKKEKNKKEKQKNVNIKEKIKNLFKKKKEKSVVEEIKEEIEDTFDDVIEEVEEVAEIITEKPVFISKKERTKRIVIKLLGLLFVTIIILFWLWIGILFVASLFALLDGIKLYGINIALFGLDILVLWIIIMLNKLIFKKKNNFKINLIVTLVSVFIIAIGVSMSIYRISKVEEISDVSQKYNMTTKYDTYKLPSNGEKMYITFNSNYDTQYTVKYDNKLKDKFKIEVKYYETYYDYYTKKTSNNIYISLSKDTRDRISAYIDDFKENKVYKETELSRYTVKITISEEDYQRLIINN